MRNTGIQESIMRAVNLYLLTRTHEPDGLSLILEAMSKSRKQKEVSAHEAATLWSLTDVLARYLQKHSRTGSDDWVSLLDGFFFSYVIEHIGKEFDLLKTSGDGSCILNIELKSEMVEEERIRKQLEQNRYYLSHIANTICSFTYVMETGELYCLDEQGLLRKCGIEEVVDALQMEVFRDYLSEGIENCFRTAEYLISPIANPQKFLQGKYFLTNQQFEFRRKILGYLQEHTQPDTGAPVISVSGIAGTGKTLLLLDLSIQLSKNGRVLFIHSGPLRRGHIEINEELDQVDLISGDRFRTMCHFEKYHCLIVDEADHLDLKTLRKLLAAAGTHRIPVILAFDPHRLLAETAETDDVPAGRDDLAEVRNLIIESSSLALSFTGNIRINRPVYSFLRTLLNYKDHGSSQGYECIDVLYADDMTERRLIEDYYRKRDFALVSRSEGAEKEEDVIAREYDNVLMTLDDAYYYDENMRLRVKENEEESLRLLYEGLSRTRERLCLLIAGNQELFKHVLAIRLGRAKPAGDRLEKPEPADITG